MTFTIEKKKAPAFLKISQLRKTFKLGFAGVGLFTVAVIILLASNSAVCNSAANALSKWANPVATADQIIHAPFEIEELEGTDVTIPDGMSKVPVATLASLPVIEVHELTAGQAKITRWIAKRYHVAPEMVALLVQEAWTIGEQKNLDPTLFLAIMAIESRYNPYAQSSVGATGLMQVMTNVHAEKLERTGGAVTVFDPVTNLRVGVQILEEHVKRAGSLEGGLKQYVGAVGPSDYGYAAKVLAERDRIRRVVFNHSNPTLSDILEVGQQG